MVLVMVENPRLPLVWVAEIHFAQVDGLNPQQRSGVYVHLLVAVQKPFEVQIGYRV